MKFLIDVDSLYSLVKIFNKHSYNAIHVKDILKFATDDKIFEYAKRNQYIIVTRDLGFAEMALSKRGVGLILIRLPYYFKSEKVINIFDEFLDEIDAKQLSKSITVWS